MDEATKVDKAPAPNRRATGASTRHVIANDVDFPHIEPGRHNVLLIGLNRRSRRYLAAAEAFRSKGVRIVGVLDIDHRKETENSAACKALLERLNIREFGSVHRLKDVLRHVQVDEVLVTLPIKSCYDDIDEVLGVCEEAGVPASLSTDLFDRSSARLCVIGNRHGRSRINYSCAQRHWRDRFLKRSLDIVGALVALAIFGVPMLLIALAIKLTSRGPVLFAQERLGLNHRTFKILKFRTMVVGAEALKQQLHGENEMDGPVFKIKKDPRVTKIGRILRKLSLDELPQFINVLRGDMSLVGPRPPIASEVAQYEWWQRRRLSTRPGVTCYWQISGRNEISFEEWMRLDLKYIDNWSILLDLELLLKTIPAVLLGRGAS